MSTFLDLSFFVLFAASSSAYFNEQIEEAVSTDPRDWHCGKDKIFSPCYNNNCVRKYCEEDAPSPDCKQEEDCKPGCLCKEGFLRRTNDTCVPEAVCTNPIKCGENETFSNCKNGGCSIDNCFEIGIAPYCKDLLPGGCESGCICKRNYLRTAAGTCVPINDCPKNEICPGPHKYYDLCPPLCPARDCTLDDSSTACPPEEHENPCYPSCRCEEGFYMNSNHDCVPYEDCSKECNGIREIYLAYPENCEEQTCDTIENLEIKEPGINKTCKGECRCLPGHVRNKHGECIAKENCGKCQGPNEHFGCSSPCDNVCATLDKMNRTMCPIMTEWAFCVDMCYCDDGYARDANNTCVPVAECLNSSSSEKSDLNK